MDTNYETMAEAARRVYRVADRIITGRTDLDVKTFDAAGHSGQDMQEFNDQNARYANKVSHQPPPGFYMDGQHVYWSAEWLRYWMERDLTKTVLFLDGANFHECAHFLYTPDWDREIKAVRVITSRVCGALRAASKVDDLPEYVKRCLPKQYKIDYPVPLRMQKRVGNASSVPYGTLIDLLQRVFGDARFFRNLLEDCRVEALMEVHYPGTIDRVTALMATWQVETISEMDRRYEHMVEKVASQMAGGQKTMEPKARKLVLGFVWLMQALICSIRPRQRYSNLAKYAWMRSGAGPVRQNAYRNVIDSVHKADVTHDRNETNTTVNMLSVKLLAMAAQDFAAELIYLYGSGLPDVGASSSQTTAGGTMHPDSNSKAPSKSQFHPSDTDDKETSKSEKQAADKAAKKLMNKEKERASEEASEEGDGEEVQGAGGDESDPGGDTGSGESEDGTGTGGSDGEGDGEGAGETDEEVDGEGGGSGMSAGGKVYPTRKGGKLDMNEVRQDLDKLVTTVTKTNRERLVDTSDRIKKLAMSEEVEILGQARNSNTTTPHPTTVITVRNTLQHFKRLTENIEPGWDHDEPQGRVNPQAVIRAQGTHHEVFDRWNEGAEEETSMEVIVLIDTSSSMGMNGYDPINRGQRQVRGGNIVPAAQGAWAIKRTVEEVNGKCAVLTFGSGWSTLYPARVKASKTVVLQPIPSGGTSIGESIEVVLHRMGQSRRKHKALFVLTDGRITDIESVARIMPQLTRLGVHSVLYEVGMGDNGPGWQRFSVDHRAPWNFTAYGRGDDASGLAKLGAEYVKRVAASAKRR